MKIQPFLRAVLPWIAGALISLSVGVYFRLYPFYHNVSADAYEQATMLVLARVRTGIAEGIRRQRPDLPVSELQSLVQQEFNRTLRDERERVQKAFDDVGLQILGQTGEKKHYLLASDSYYFLDLTQRIIDDGDISPKIEGNRYFNDKMLAPLGFWEPHTWHPYLGAWTCKLVKRFNPGADVMFGVAFTPVVLLPLALAAFLFACRALRCSPFPSFIASIFFILAPIFLKRSTFAWYDNDIYTLFFPLAALGFIFAALKTKKLVHAIILTSLSMATAVLYGRFWPGWGFLPIFILIGLLLSGTWGIITTAKDRRRPFILSAAVLASALIALLVTYTPSQIIDIFTHAAGELSKFTSPRLNGWPDLFIVVGELKKGTVRDLVQLSGGLVSFIGAITALIFYGMRMITRRQRLPAEIVLLGFYFAASSYLALDAQRFIILSVVPVMLLFALILEELWIRRFIIAQRAADIRIPSLVFHAGLAISFILLTIFPLMASQKDIRSLLNPIYNSTWDKALTKLREQTPPDAIINAWWSPGHFIKAEAWRRVIFDGASIRGDIAYWLNKIYLSQTEEEALGILRMVNTGSNEATLFLEKAGWPLSKAVRLITGIVALPRNEASDILRKVLSANDTQKVLDLTHGKGKLPPSYLLVYNENVDGNILFAYLDKWNFDRIETLNANPEAVRRVPAKSSPAFVTFIWDLVGGPYRQSNVLNPVAENGTRIRFDQGVEIDTASMSARIESPTFGRGIPASIVYLNADGQVTERTLPNATLSYSLVFFRDQNAPRAALMDRRLANSLIIKMYYFDGAGLVHFKPFAKEADLSGRTKIFIYEVKWPKVF